MRLWDAKYFNYACLPQIYEPDHWESPPPPSDPEQGKSCKPRLMYARTEQERRDTLVYAVHITR